MQHWLHEESSTAGTWIGRHRLPSYAAVATGHSNPPALTEVTAALTIGLVPCQVKVLALKACAFLEVCSQTGNLCSWKGRKQGISVLGMAINLGLDDFSGSCRSCAAFRDRTFHSSLGLHSFDPAHSFPSAPPTPPEACLGLCPFRFAITSSELVVISPPPPTPPLMHAHPIFISSNVC